MEIQLIWLIIETVIAIASIWFFLCNIWFLYYCWENFTLRSSTYNFMEILRSLQLFTIVFTVIWQYADLQVNWDTGRVTTGCSSIRVVTVAFVVIFILHNWYFCSLSLYPHPLDYDNHIRCLRYFGYVINLSFFIVIIAAQFYSDTVQENNGICQLTILTDRNWLLRAVYVEVASTTYTWLMHYLFAYWIRKKNSRLCFRHKKIAMIGWLATTGLLISLGIFSKSPFHNLMPFAIFVMIGLAQYLWMGVIYLSWSGIFCPHRVLRLNPKRITNVNLDTEIGPITNPILLTNCIPENISVERRGVTFSFFINWARFYNNQIPGAQTRDLVTQVITPDTAKENGPYWIKVPSRERGRPHVFISHAWDMSVLDLIEALVDWRENYVTKRKSCGCCGDGFRYCTGFCVKNLQCKIRQDPILWIDIFAIPQNKGYHNENDVKMLDQTIRSIGHLALCTDVAYTPMTRSWCLFELANASLFNSRITFGLSSGFTEEKWMKRGELAGSINVEDAETGNPEDKVMIDNLIFEQFGSFQNLNLEVKALLEPRLQLSPALEGLF